MVGGPLRLHLHWRGPAQGGEQVQVAEAIARLPALPAGAYHTMFLDLPGDARDALTLTISDAGGQVKTIAGPGGWARRGVRLPAPAPGARFVPFSDVLALVGAAPDGEHEVAPGEPLTVRLTFLALKPLVTDNSVNVSLWDESGALRARHDLQPALGAIPTLKWITGARVVDPHPLQVPADVDTGAVSATLVVYERFRGTPLRPLDGRVGEVQVPLGAWPLGKR
jgi:hypothetical protein